MSEPTFNVGDIWINVSGLDFRLACIHGNDCRMDSEFGIRWVKKQELISKWTNLSYLIAKSKNENQ